MKKTQQEVSHLNAHIMKPFISSSQLDEYPHASEYQFPSNTKQPHEIHSLSNTPHLKSLNKPMKKHLSNRNSDINHFDKQQENYVQQIQKLYKNRKIFAPINPNIQEQFQNQFDQFSSPNQQSFQPISQEIIQNKDSSSEPSRKKMKIPYQRRRKSNQQIELLNSNIQAFLENVQLMNSKLSKPGYRIQRANSTIRRYHSQKHNSNHQPRKTSFNISIKI